MQTALDYLYSAATAPLATLSRSQWRHHRSFNSRSFVIFCPVSRVPCRRTLAFVASHGYHVVSPRSGFDISCPGSCTGGSVRALKGGHTCYPRHFCAATAAAAAASNAVNAASAALTKRVNRRGCL